jgi:RNA polymerase sigma factor (sigma-70 family)
MAVGRPTLVTSEELYAEFVNARASALLRTAILLTAGDRATAEDVVQTALAGAYAKRRRIRTPAATEADARRTLVRAVVRGRHDNARLNAVADRDVRRPTTLPDALRALPVRQRATIVLRYYDDYSEAQVADALGCSAGTVRRHSTRAFETLGEPWAADEQLRTSMAAAADPVRADPELVIRVIEGSRSARRRRRQTYWLTGCAAALAALVGAGVTFFDGSDDSPTEPDPPPVVDVDPIAWARQLPQGAPVRLAYLANGAIHVPDQPEPLPRQAVRPIGKTAEGWLVNVAGDARQGQGGPSVGLGYGLVTANGAIEPLPQDPYDGPPMLEALSPDGKLFAVGGALVDLGQRRVVGRTPAGALYSTGWTPVGMVYIGGPYESGWLWRPGSPPIGLPVRIWDTATNAPIALATSRHDCVNVVRLTADGDVSPIYDDCASGASSPVSLSPDGSHAVTAALDVLDVDEGTITPYGLPTRGIAGMLAWEDDDHFVLPFETQQTATRDRAVFVRCSVTTQECERAGPEFTKPAPEQVLVG